MASTETPIGKGAMISAGVRDYPVARPAKTAGQLFGVAIDRTGWADPATSVKVAVLISEDGGGTWREWCSMTESGGVRLGPDKQPILRSSFAASAPPDGALLKLSMQSNGKLIKQDVAFLELT